MSQSDQLTQLLDEAPSLHDDGASGTKNVGLAPEVLRWLWDHLPAQPVTLETGCGYSTVVFAARSGQHWAISPFPSEHERIREWCTARGVKLDHVHFVAAGSEQALPPLQTPPLDLVLVDGRHAFPTPYIDWYYTAPRLKVGGLMALDDVPLRPVRVLCEFLRAERGRWELVARFWRTWVFRKLTDDLAFDREFGLQPWSMAHNGGRDLVRAWVAGATRTLLAPFPRAKDAVRRAMSRA